VVKNSPGATAATTTTTSTGTAIAAANRKERSVLQAKLTKLAIQIGYAGT